MQLSTLQIAGATVTSQGQRAGLSEPRWGPPDMQHSSAVAAGSLRMLREKQRGWPAGPRFCVGACFHFPEAHVLFLYVRIRYLFYVRKAQVLFFTYVQPKYVIFFSYVRLRYFLFYVPGSSST